MTTEIIERMKLIDVSEQEVARKACELEAKIKRPAEAEKHRCQVLAEAAKSKTLSEASGAAEGIALKGDAEAEAIEIKAKVAFTYDVRCFGSFLTYLPTYPPKSDIIRCGLTYLPTPRSDINFANLTYPFVIPIKRNQLQCL